MSERIPLEEATFEQLHAYATTILGIEVKKGTNGPQLRSKIEATGTKEIILPDAPEQPSHEGAPPPRVGVKPKQIADVRKGEPTVELTINEQSGAGGKRAIPVGVNGVMILLPRAERIKIAYRYYVALNNAIKTLYETDQETGDVIDRDVPSYPFQVHRMPPDDELAAWLEKDAKAA